MYIYIYIPSPPPTCQRSRFTKNQSHADANHAAAAITAQSIYTINYGDQALDVTRD